MDPQLQQQLAPMALAVLRLCAWLALLATVFVPIERLFPLHRQKVFRGSVLADVGYFFIGGLLPRLLLILPLAYITAVIHGIVPGGYYAAAAQLPFWVRLPAALVVGEIGAYWAHRLAHDIPFLWRFHAIHHSAREIDWLVNSRGHPLDLAFTRLCALVPMYALGIAQPMAEGFDLVPVVVVLTGTIWGFFIHANVRWRFGALEWVVSTPAFHHWHHANDGPDLIHQNFAPMLPWIDRLFGTHHLPARDWPRVYGTDTQVDSTLVGQLVQPFRINGAPVAPPAKPADPTG